MIASSAVEYSYEGLDEAFPEIDPNIEPFGERVLVQVRLAKNTTKSGIILTTDQRDTEAYNTQVAKLIKCGALAFRNRTTMEPWPEGAWCSVGEFVRIPRYAGDRWVRKHKVGDSVVEIVLAIFKDTDLLGRITGNPLESFTVV